VNSSGTESPEQSQRAWARVGGSFQALGDAQTPNGELVNFHAANSGAANGHPADGYSADGKCAKRQCA
jgi:hypothetical protein